MSDASEITYTDDRILGGRVRLLQPASGFRAAIDPVLLAACVPAQPGDSVLDLGCGVGTAGLALAARVGGLDITGLERDPNIAGLAAHNGCANGLTGAGLEAEADRQGSFRVVVGDVLAPPKAIVSATFEHVFANPPFGVATRERVSPEPGRAAAAMEGDAGVDDWVCCAVARVRPGGTVTLIHRSDRLPELIVALSSRLGGVAVFPLWPRAGVPAKRVLVAGQKGSRAPFRLLSGLILHQGDGRYTKAAEAVLRNLGAIDLRGKDAGSRTATAP